jgi:hypothetical protein
MRLRHFALEGDDRYWIRADYRCSFKDRANLSQDSAWLYFELVRS